jgi:hypothetical protein
MSKTGRTVILVIALILAMGAGAAISFYVSLRHQRFGFFTPKDVEAIQATADLARAAVMRNPSCSVTVDESSLGDKRQETMMLYAAAMVDLYQIGFGSLPTRTSELDKLSQFDKASKLNGRKLDTVCSIYTNGTGSFVVSCGQARPAELAVAEFMRKAENVKRFHALGQAEILYVPAAKCS